MEKHDQSSGEPDSPTVGRRRRQFKERKGLGVVPVSSLIRLIDDGGGAPARRILRKEYNEFHPHGSIGRVPPDTFPGNTSKPSRLTISVVTAAANYASSSPLIVPVLLANLSFSSPRRCNMET